MRSARRLALIFRLAQPLGQRADRPGLVAEVKRQVALRGRQAAVPQQQLNLPDVDAAPRA